MFNSYLAKKLSIINKPAMACELGIVAASLSPPLPPHQPLDTTLTATVPLIPGRGQGRRGGKGRG